MILHFLIGEQQINLVLALQGWSRAAGYWARGRYRISGRIGNGAILSGLIVAPYLTFLKKAEYSNPCWS